MNFGEHLCWRWASSYSLMLGYNMLNIRHSPTSKRAKIKPRRALNMKYKKGWERHKNMMKNNDPGNAKTMHPHVKWLNHKWSHQRISNMFYTSQLKYFTYMTILQHLKLTSFQPWNPKKMGREKLTQVWRRMSKKLARSLMNVIDRLITNSKLMKLFKTLKRFAQE